MNGTRSHCATFVFFSFIACGSFTAHAQSGPQPTGIPGPNVNIIGPTPVEAHVPDKTFKQQNEPSCAVQPSNALNIFCGYNDYRGVDIPTIGDAWIGTSMSRNGGETWTSRLAPGFPGDAPSLNEQFAADASAAAVPGMALLGFIAAGRDSQAQGGMFLQRWTEENKEDGAPWKHLDTLPIFSGTSGQFLDKPAMLVTLSGTTPVSTTLATGVTRDLVPAVIHVAYSNFSGNDSNDSAAIYYTRSTDYGQTWSNKDKLSESISLNQGVAMAANGDTILAVWRQFDKNNNQADSFTYALSQNGGRTWIKPLTVPLPASSICTFDQPSQLPESNYAFRTRALPSLVSDGNRFYLFWAKRTQDEFGNESCTRGRSRVAYLSTADGMTWDLAPRLVDEQPGKPFSHQFMPAAFAAGGVVQATWYDTRDDEFLNANNTYRPYVLDEAGSELDQEGQPINRRHTADVYHAQGRFSGGQLQFPTGAVKVSQYAVGRENGSRNTNAQLERNYINARLFKQATKPFMGDYNGVAAPAFRLNGSQWVSNQGAVSGVAADPTFFSVWADNRDVRTNVYQQSACVAGAIPGSAECPSSSAYTPANAEPPVFAGERGSNSTGQCVADFGSYPPFSSSSCSADESPEACYAGYVAGYEAYLATLKWPASGQKSLKSLSRNQNVYGAVIKPGVVVGAASANKPTSIQRAFVVYVQNGRDFEDQTFVLNVTPVSPSGSGSSGDWVSFTQYRNNVSGQVEDRWLAVPVPQASVAARTVFVQSTASIQARVDVYAASSCTGTDTDAQGNPPSCSNLVASVTLNGNTSAGNLTDPDCRASGTCAKNDPEGVIAWESHNPELTGNLYSVDYSSTQSPSLRNPSLRNPSLRNSVYESPSLRNETVEFPSLRNPSLRNSPITDESAAEAQKFTDFVYDVYNAGNTTSAYTLKPLIVGDLVDSAGNPIIPQLIVSRVYDEQTAQNCEVATLGRQQVIVSIPYPDVAPTTVADPLADPGLNADQRHATFFAEPGGKLQVTLRVWGVDAVLADSQFRNRVYMKIYSQALNSDESRGQKLSFDVIGCPMDQPECKPDVTKPEFVIPEGFPLNFPQEADTPFRPATEIEASRPGGWLSDFPNPGVEDESAVTVACTNQNVVLPVGPQEVTCTATDAAGNVETAFFQFVVTDTTPPVVTVSLPPPAEGNTLLVEAVGPLGTEVTFGASSDDIVNGPTLATACSRLGADGSVIEVSIGRYLFPIGVTEVTCQSSDPSKTWTVPAPGGSTGGGTGTATFTITVEDSTAPVVTVPADIVAEATSAAGATVDYAAATFSDAVGVASSGCTPASGSAFGIGATTVNCTATDTAGNTGSASFTVTVGDTTPPPFYINGSPLPPGGSLASIIQEATGPTGAIVTYATPTAVDAVSLTTVVCLPASGSVFALGNTTVTCTATDAAGNAGTATFTVTVKDETAPVVTAPANVFAEATNAGGVTVAYTSATFSDAVGVVSSSCTPASGSTFAIGTTPVTCTATDAAGNNGTATFTVTVSDKTAPSLTVPAPITAEATSALGAVVSFTASATDSVSSSLATTCTPASGSTFAIGATPVTCTATDAAGNTGSATFTVTVRDTTAPSLTVPANITTTTSGTTAAVTYSVTATDSVSGSVAPTCSSSSPGVSGVSTTGGTFPVGTSTVNCSAKDAASNSTSKSFTVKVSSAGYSGLDGVYANGPKSRTSAVPLDFGFTGTTGARVDSSLARPVVKVYYAGAKCPGTKPANPTFTYPSGGSDYRYSASSLNWQFNWKPSVNRLLAGCYYVAVKSDQTGQEFNSTKSPITLTK